MSEQLAQLISQNQLFPFLISPDMNPYFIEGHPPYEFFTKESKVRIQEAGAYVEQNKRRLIDLGMVTAHMVGPDSVGLGIKNVYECCIEHVNNSNGEISAVNLTRGELKPALADLRLFVKDHPVDKSLQANIGNIEYPHQNVAISLYPYEQVMENVTNPKNLPTLVSYGVWNHGYTFYGASALNNIRTRAMQTIQEMSPDEQEQLRQCVHDHIIWKKALMDIQEGKVDHVKISHYQIPALSKFLYSGTI